jgi:tetratricopeptide (TPR) repeat protein
VSVETTLGRRSRKEAPGGSEPQFVTAILPWVVAGGALLFFLATLNHWVSLSSLPEVARLSGWIWQPELFAPVTWLVTLPLRALPLKAIPLALNFVAALCAVLTLALLARSVAILPHDRTHEQRLRARPPSFLLSMRFAWLPPVFAALVCALQLSFWENATSASSPDPPLGSGLEILNVLVFAYIIRCLLEFRLEPRDSWLMKAAFVYGLSITNNWGMVPFLPIMVAALVWLKGLEFFNVQFLVRIFLWGLLGLSLFLLLPLVHSRSDALPLPFWYALKTHLASQKTIIGSVFSKFNLLHADRPLWILSIFSLLPILLVAIRWPSYFGDTSKLGITISTIGFHIVHAFLLLFCLWVAFDPPLSPRAHPFSEGYGMSFLPLYYLGALTIGYFAGYFLLIFTVPAPETRPNLSRPNELLRNINRAVAAAVWILFVLTPTLLVLKNLPQIRLTNGRQLPEFASVLGRGLPTTNAIVLSDDRRRGLLLQSAMAQRGLGKGMVFVDTASLQFPEYHRYLKRQHPKQWPITFPRNENRIIDSIPILQIVASLTLSNQVFYLHPSFGYYFERLYAEPHGLAYRLDLAPTNSLIVPRISPELLQTNKTYWSEAERLSILPLVAAVGPSATGTNRTLLDRLLGAVHVKKEPNREASVLALSCSRSLNAWGVDLQKSGDLETAARQFELAQKLNPDNVAAKINLDCNRNLRTGRKSDAAFPKFIQDAFGKFSDWEPVLTEDGPFDEPRICYDQGLLYMKNSLYRQAANLFDRVRFLDPGNLAARVWLAQVCVMNRLGDEALGIVKGIREQPDVLPIARTNESAVLFVEASAHLVGDDSEGAQACIDRALAKYGEDLPLLATATKAYMDFQRFSNAVPLLDRQLKLRPDDPRLLLNKGFSLLQLDEFDPAIAAFNSALKLDTNATSEVHETALLDRSIAYVRSGNLADSQRDLELLEKSHPDAYPVKYWLGEIFYRKSDTNSAIRCYQLYLSKAPTNTQEASVVLKRMHELKPGFPRTF